MKNRFFSKKCFFCQLMHRFIPTLGLIYSHAGTMLFPAWEQFFFCSIHNGWEGTNKREKCKKLRLCCRQSGTGPCLMRCFFFVRYVKYFSVQKLPNFLSKKQRFWGILIKSMNWLEWNREITRFNSWFYSSNFAISPYRGILQKGRSGKKCRREEVVK